jgi:hypothetical protein
VTFRELVEMMVQADIVQLSSMNRETLNSKGGFDSVYNVKIISAEGAWVVWGKLIL